MGDDNDWRSVSTHGWNTCAIRTDNSLWCWGSNERGQVGDGTTTDRLVPTAIGQGQAWWVVSVGAVSTTALSLD